MNIKIFALTAFLATPFINSTLSAADYYGNNNQWNQGNPGGYRIEVQEDASYPYGRDQRGQRDQYGYGNSQNQSNYDPYNYGTNQTHQQSAENYDRYQTQNAQGFDGRDQRFRKALDRRIERNLDSICSAIRQQKRLEITVVNEAIANKKEVTIETKKIVVEPYAFGMTNDGKPAFYGKAIEDNLESEVTVKFGKDRFDDQAIKASSTKDDKVSSGWFGSDEGVSGWFGGKKNKDIDFRFIKNIRVIENSHFDAPKDFEGYNKQNVQIICQLPITKAPK